MISVRGLIAIAQTFFQDLHFVSRNITLALITENLIEGTLLKYIMLQLFKHTI